MLEIAIHLANYCLSDERDRITSEANKKSVTDADIANAAAQLRAELRKGAMTMKSEELEDLACAIGTLENRNE